MSSLAVKVSKLSKIYGKTTAVKEVSFEIETGTITALLGGNGAGKTTIISMLLGLLTPTSGAIRLLGEPMPEQKQKVIPKINFASPYVDLPKRLTVRQNLDVFASLYGLQEPKRRIEQLCEELHLENIIDRPTGKLSSGQATRVGLAKALINAPCLLLLDEPTASLDPDTADWVREYLRAYRNLTGATIILASHNMTEVERVCENVLMLKSGSIIDHGSPLSLVERYSRQNLEQVFLEIARSPDGAQ